MELPFGYDPKRGLYLPGTDPRRYRAGPNPESPPPIEPRWQRELEAIGRRICRQLRFYWMKDARIWSIQQLEDSGRWETVCCNYDEWGQHDGNQYPYRPVDQRFLDEFCESDLKQTIGTGDILKDHRIYEAQKLDRATRDAQRKSDAMAELIERIVFGDDPRRFFRLMQHEETHNGGGVRFQEFFRGADLR